MEEISIEKEVEKIPKKREIKMKRKLSPISEMAHKNEAQRKMWHCFLPTKEGSRCTVKTLATSKMRNHLKTRAHFGKDYVAAKFPKGVKLCSGSDCEHCKSQGK
jgi:hypothetical protein